MKQCKVCGTLVHIDSNTCPSCGNHNFFVLDVKICPLCGKVNNISSSFCEQCGKQFVAAQGNPYINKVIAPKTSISQSLRERPVFKHLDDDRDKDYEIEKPQVKIAKSFKIEENAAERAYKDFMALKPEVNEKDDYSEYSYYVKGDANKLPVIILPKFAKTQGKNILVNIVVNSEKEAQNIESRIEEQNKQHIVFDKSENLPEHQVPPVAENEQNKVFKPFSAINDPSAINDITESVAEEKKLEPVTDNKTEENKTDFVINKDEKKKKELPLKKYKNLKVKPLKPKIGASSVFGSILIIFSLLGLIASFSMVFYSSDTDIYRTAGVSPVVYLLNNLLNTNIILPFTFDNGFVTYWNAFNSGQFSHLAHLVPYLFSTVIACALINLILTIFTFRQRRFVKAIMFLLGGLGGLCLIVIALSTKYVYNSGAIKTLGLGLIVAGVMSLLNFILILMVYKPQNVKK